MSVSSIDHGVSLRLNPGNQTNFKQSQKALAVQNQSSNFQLINNKSMRNFVGARRGTMAAGPACTSTTAGRTTDQVPSKVGLRINSHRQDIVGGAAN